MLVVDNFRLFVITDYKAISLFLSFLLLQNVLCAPAYNYLDPQKLNSVHKLTNLNEAGYVQEIR